MLNNQNTIIISPENLLDKISEMNRKRLRLIQICCTKNENFEITYSFDNNYNIDNLRIIIPFDTEIESICPVYEYAYIYENEIKDLFGVKINNIVPDFKGNFYKTDKKTPFLA